MTSIRRKQRNSYIRKYETFFSLRYNTLSNLFLSFSLTHSLIHSARSLSLSLSPSSIYICIYIIYIYLICIWRYFICEGEPGEELVKQADLLDCTLIICGCRGLSFFKRAFFGSVGEYLTQHSPFPLAIVHSKITSSGTALLRGDEELEFLPINPFLQMPPLARKKRTMICGNKRNFI